MASSLKSVGAITLFVEDPQRSKSFYTKVFEVEPVFEDSSSVAFRFDNMIINLLQRPSADELVTPGKVAPAGAGSSFQLTIWVDDTHAVLTSLAAKGVSPLNGPIDRPWGMRTATIADLDGHVWEFAQAIK